MANVVLTEDEIIATINRSSCINILVEGPGDLMIYNHLEDKFSDLKYSVLPCGGRNTLLKVFDKRSEYSEKEVVFIADQDIWAFQGIPEVYNDCIFTSGYSIENDLFDFGKTLIIKLLREGERIQFFTLLENLLPWYCSEIHKCLSGGAAEISKHLNEIIPIGAAIIPEDYLEKYPLSTYDDELPADVKRRNYLKLRGKFIFQALSRFLSARGRRSKYSNANIMEICLIAENSHFDRIYEEVLSRTG
jgi:hypothetical protein